jgi:hypothetical protein
VRVCRLLVGSWVLAASVTVALAPSPVAAGPEGAGAADAAAAAQAHAEALVDAVVLPPGAVPVKDPPSPALAAPSESVSYGHAATAARLWVVPGSAAGVEAFFGGRAEAGVRATGR